MGTVTAQVTRINDMEDVATGQTATSIGGGAGAGNEGTIYYQNVGSVGRKVTSTTTPAGFGLTQSATSDISTATGTYQTIMFKYNVVTSPDLDPQGATGLILRAGESATVYEEYYADGADTYNARGGWRIKAIDPNIAGYIDDSTNGNPNFANFDYVAIVAAFVNGGAKDLNVLIDALDVGNGLTVTGASSSFEDFRAFDEDTATNRYGFVAKNESGLEILGTLAIGSATSTQFTSSGDVLSFADGRFAAGWSGLSIDIQNAGTTVDILASSFFGLGNTTTTDTRPVFTVSGTSGSVDVANGALFDSWASFTLNAQCTFDASTIADSGLIDLGSGATFTNMVVTTPTVAADAPALLWNVALDPNGELDNLRISQGTNAHHAIEFGANAPQTMTITGWTIIGFTATNEQNNSTLYFADTGADVTWTVNIIGGTGNFSYKKARAGDTVVLVISPVTFKVTARDAVTNSLIQNARVAVEAGDATGDLFFETSVTITRSGSTATVSHTAHGLTTGAYVSFRGANLEIEYRGAKQVTVTGVNSYTFTVSGTPTTPASTPITATEMIIFGLTDSLGVISASRTYSVDQVYRGYARKFDTSPLYKTANISGTLDKDIGENVSAQLISDE